MKFFICGTAAAEAIPAVFCTCDLCRYAHTHRGRNARSRAAYHLGEYVHIDWGPDSIWQGQRFSLRYDQLKHLLITHSHDDHWYVRDFVYRRKGFSRVDPDTVLTIYGNEAVGASLHAVLGDNLEDYALRFEVARPHQPIELPDVGLTVIPVEADHEPSETSLNYLINDQDHWLFQGNDTGFPIQRTWDFLKDFKLDTVLLDCTAGGLTGWRKGHMSMDVVIQAFDKLDAQGSLSENAQLIATHFSHNGKLTHEQLVDLLQPHGIAPAYDGMTLIMS